MPMFKQYDFMSPKSFAPSENYIKQASNQLLFDFPFLGLLGSKEILKLYQNHYAITHDKILTGIKGTTAKGGEELEQTQHQRILLAIAGHRLDRDQIHAIGAIYLGQQPNIKDTAAVTNLNTDLILQEESSYVKGKSDEWMTTVKNSIEREVRKKVSQRTDNAIECACCYDSYHNDDMVTCQDERHLFCTKCLKLFAENQIFGQGNLGIDKNTNGLALELKCFHSDGCTSGFSRASLEKALPPKLMKNYDEVQFKIKIEIAGLRDICYCPQCGFQADVPPMQKVFSCPVDECAYQSCRECGEASHIPLG
jgi:hypothetical protein